jgi:hypothetical protein
MKIAILVEGATEVAFLPFLREFLKPRLANRMPRLDLVPYDGRIPMGDKLRSQVTILLTGQRAADAVIALTDVYTGSRDFTDANDAKTKMRRWVGDEPRFYPHVAMHDFEAWLLPFWDRVKELSGSNRNAPGKHPEKVNHQKSPAKWLDEIFRSGTKHKYYVKPIHAARILRGQDLMVSANVCPELKLFLNTILKLSGGKLL